MPAAGQDVAFSDTDLSIAAPYLIRIQATLSTDSTGGLIFDQYSATEFKFAAISSETGQVIIGHYTSRKGWVIDASTDRSIASGTDYELQVTLKGTTVSVELDGEVVLSHQFNANIVDGDFGLMTRDGASSFASVTVSTDDPAFIDDAQDTAGPDALLAEAPATSNVGDPVLLTEEAVYMVLDEAIDRLALQFGLDQVVVSTLSEIDIRIDDLPGLLLGIETDTGIVLDIDAAGHGWFVDSTPGDDAEFRRPVPGGLSATPSSAAFSKIDLLSVLMHELGHVIDLDDLDPQENPYDLMTSVLGTGVRRINTTDEAV
jgi:hypothetical protein